MSWTVVGQGSNSFGGVSSGDDFVDVAWGFTPQAGDLAFVAAALFAGGTAAQFVRDYNDTASATWANTAGLYADDTRDCTLTVFYKFLDASDLTGFQASRYVGNTGPTMGQSWIVVRGALSSPFDTATTTATGTDSRLADPPAITPATAGSLIIPFWAAVCGNAGVGDPALYDAFFASNFAVRACTEGTSEGYVANSYYETSSASLINPAAWSTTTAVQDCWCACTIALRTSVLSIAQSTGPAVSGTLALAGDLSISASGAPFELAQSTGVSLAGALGVAGDLAQGVELSQSTGVSLAGALGVAGDLVQGVELSQSTGVSLAGALGVAGDLVQGVELSQSTGVSLAGSLGVAGDLRVDSDQILSQSTGVGVAGVLGIAGDLAVAAGEIFLAQSTGVSLAGSLGVAGDLVQGIELAQSTGVSLAGVLGVAGDLVQGVELAQSTGVGLAGALGIAGDLVQGIELSQSTGVSLTGALGVAGDLDVVALPGTDIVQVSGVGLVSALGVLGDLVASTATVVVATTGWTPPKRAKRPRRPRVYRLPLAEEPELEVVETLEAPDFGFEEPPTVRVPEAPRAPAGRPVLTPFEAQVVRSRLTAPRRPADDTDDDLVLLLLMLY